METGLLSFLLESNLHPKKQTMSSIEHKKEQEDRPGFPSWLSKVLNLSDPHLSDLKNNNDNSCFLELT